MRFSVPAASIVLLFGCRTPDGPARAAPTIDVPPAAARAAADGGTQGATASAQPAVAPRTEYVLGDGELTLPDGIVVVRRSSANMGLPGEHTAFTAADKTWSSYSYIEPGEAEIIHDTWVYARDARMGNGRLWRWEPRAIDLSSSSDVTMRLGDRASAGAWAIEWVGVVPGTGELTGKRVFALRSMRGNDTTDYWQYAADAPAKKDFATRSGLHHFELEVTRASVAPQATDATLLVRGREVDRAAPAAFGASLAPGLYALPDGTRVLFTKGKMCAMSMRGCTCSDVFDAAVELGDREEHVGPDLARPVRAVGHTFSLRHDQLVVTR